MFAADSRELLAKIPDGSVDCIITSPPYGELKNYGSTVQLGFGQRTTEEYLPDLERIFSELYRVSAPGAALWIVLDTWKSNGDTIPLPWEVSTRARASGWAFHDFIVWDKGRSLPWSHRGRFRGVCEYILLLGKGRLKTFNLKAVRETSNLAAYWVKYPERYHPDGKAPSDLWHFQIPTQGSWAPSARRHFCPFPTGLVERMVEISSNEGEIVLDPFAGTGTVPAVASQLNRCGVGIEINRKFVSEFQKSGFEEIVEQVRASRSADFGRPAALRKTIVNLRILKFPKTLFSELMRKDRLGESAIENVSGYLVRSVVTGRGMKPQTKESFATVALELLASPRADLKVLREEVEKLLAVPPLSKFGVDVKLKVISHRTWASWVKQETSRAIWYLYRRGTFNKFSSKGRLAGLLDELSDQTKKSKYPPVLSQISVSVSVAD